ncbi:MAG: hypothetical protein QXS93_01505 [Candidatus Micrarchaeia archaeon]
MGTGKITTQNIDKRDSSIEKRQSNFGMMKDAAENQSILASAVALKLRELAQKKNLPPKDENHKQPTQEMAPKENPSPKDENHKQPTQEMAPKEDHKQPSDDINKIMDAILVALRNKGSVLDDTANPQQIPENQSISNKQIKNKISSIRAYVKQVVTNSLKYRLLTWLGLKNDMSSMLKVLDAIECGNKWADIWLDIKRVKSNKKLTSYLKELADMGDPTAAYFMED